MFILRTLSTETTTKNRVAGNSERQKTSRKKRFLILTDLCKLAKISTAFSDVKNQSIVERALRDYAQRSDCGKKSASAVFFVQRPLHRKFESRKQSLRLPILTSKLAMQKVGQPLPLLASPVGSLPPPPPTPPTRDCARGMRLAERPAASTTLVAVVAVAARIVRRVWIFKAPAFRHKTSLAASQVCGLISAEFYL